MDPPSHLNECVDLIQFLEYNLYISFKDYISNIKLVLVVNRQDREHVNKNISHGISSNIAFLSQGSIAHITALRIIFGILNTKGEVLIYLTTLLF